MRLMISRRALVLAAVIALSIGVAPIAASGPSDSAPRDDPARLGMTSVLAQTTEDEPEVTIDAGDDMASEPGSNTGTFTVSRTGSTASAITVNYAIGGNATNASDYAGLPGSLVIAAGSDSTTITVTPIDDAVPEGPETVTLTLTSGTGYTVGSPSSDTVTIADDDPPVVTIDATDETASEPGSDTGTFTLTRTGPTATALTVNVSVGGTAVAGSDYTSIPATVTIGSGSSTAVVTVTPINDAVAEGSETVSVTVGAGTGYTVGSPSSDTVTIRDDDQPVVAVDATDDAATEGGGTGTFTVSRTGSTASAITVSYSIGGTATNGGDYAGLPGSVVIPAGMTSAAITVLAIDDALVESSETVTLTLQPGAGYTVGSPSSDTVTIADNDTAGVVTITATDATAGEAGPTTGTFTVTRTGSTASPITINYTVGGTATNGSDYAVLGGSVVIGAGVTSAAVTVLPINDSLVESGETVVLTLQPGVGYSVGSPSSATLTIADDDGPGPDGPMPITKDQCKEGGWTSFGVFKNQGDCVSFVATGGKNPPAGG